MLNSNFCKNNYSKTQLSKKSQTQVLLMLESIQKMLEERIMPRQESIEEALEKNSWKNLNKLVSKMLEVFVFRGS